MSTCARYPNCEHDVDTLCPYCMHPMGRRRGCCGEAGHAEDYCIDEHDQVVEDDEEAA